MTDTMAAAAGQDLYTVNQLADALGITPRAIRFYESKGLIAPSRVGTMRVFTRQDRGRLLLVLRGIRLGLSLAEVRDYLDLYDTDPTQHGQVRLLLGKVNERIATLEAQRQDLDQALTELRAIAARAEASVAAEAHAGASEAHAPRRGGRGGQG